MFFAVFASLKSSYDTDCFCFSVFRCFCITKLLIRYIYFLSVSFASLNISYNTACICFSLRLSAPHDLLSCWGAKRWITIIVKLFFYNIPLLISSPQVILYPTYPKWFCVCWSVGRKEAGKGVVLRLPSLSPYVLPSHTFPPSVPMPFLPPFPSYAQNFTNLLKDRLGMFYFAFSNIPFHSQDLLSLPFPRLPSPSIPKTSFPYLASLFPLYGQNFYLLFFKNF